MCLWAIVPVKPLRRGKSRLSSILKEEDRTILNQSMLINTIRTLKSVPEIDQVLVVSRDQAALTLARDYGARTLLEDGNPGLNTALRRATRVVQAYSACGVLILPADLPLIDPDVVHRFLAVQPDQPGICIAPDRRRQGTNALLVSPVGLIEYSFGPGSFHRHISETEEKNIQLRVVDDFALSIDLDLPEDFEFLQRIGALPMNIRDLEPERLNKAEE